MKQYVDKMIEMLGIDIHMMSDPKMIAQVLNEDMLLAGFEPAQKLLAPPLKAPISFKPMFDRTIDGIMTRNPAIQEFIKEALDSGLVNPVTSEKGKAEIFRSVHHMYVLNELIKEIVVNPDFVFEIQECLIGQREKFGISKNFVEALETLKVIYKGSMFEPTKIIGMDMVYKARALNRRSGVMSEKDIKAQIDGLRLNIFEASITDKNAGYIDNAYVGAVLAVIPPETVSLTADEHKVMLFHLSRKWVSLYETWNLAFCLGNLAYMSVLLPKLLAPAVVDATSDEYLITRSAGLWMSTIFHQFAVLRQRADVRVPNYRELAQLWGKINFKYAMELSKEEDNKTMADYDQALTITMGEIMDAMKDSMTSIPMSPDELKRLEAVYS